MKFMRVEVRAKTFPLLSEEHHKYMTYQQVRIYPSILQHHLLQLHNTNYTHPEDSDAAVMYAAIWYSAALTKRALWDPVTLVYDTPVHQIAVWSTGEQNLLCQYSTMWITTTPLHQAQISSSKMTQLKKNFPTAPLDDDIWWEDVSMMHLSWPTCVTIHAHMQTWTLHRTYHHH